VQEDIATGADLVALIECGKLGAAGGLQRDIGLSGVQLENAPRRFLTK
jgi:hypothetical protein